MQVLAAVAVGADVEEGDVVLPEIGHEGYQVQRRVEAQLRVLGGLLVGHDRLLLGLGALRLGLALFDVRALAGRAAEGAVGRGPSRVLESAATCLPLPRMFANAGGSSGSIETTTKPNMRKWSMTVRAKGIHWSSRWREKTGRSLTSLRRAAPRRRCSAAGRGGSGARPGCSATCGRGAAARPSRRPRPC